jgi:hypothetical protein
MKTQALFINAVVTYLFSAVFPIMPVQWLVSLLSLLIVIHVFRSLKPFVRGLGSLFLSVGVLMLAVHGAPWKNYVLGFGGMLNILSLFALLPIIALPVELGRYALRVQSIIQSRIKHSGALYMMTSLMSYLMCSFMNLATLPMVYHMIRPSLDLYPIKDKERFISRGITHSYSMPILWTPVASVVGVVVELTGVKWSSILPVIIPFSILGMIVDWIIGLWLAGRRRKRIDPTVLEEAAAAREIAAKAGMRQAGAEKSHHPIQIFAAILLFNGLVFVLEQSMDMGFLLLVCFTVIPFAFAWSTLLGKGRLFGAKVKETLPPHLIKMKDQFFIFLSAGFMISAIQTSGAGHVINLWIMNVKDAVGADLFLLMIPLIPLLFAFIGLHPAVGLALTAESLNPQALGISVQITAIALLTGSATAFLMGPYNATAGLMAGLTGQSSYRVSNWNAPFTAVYLLMVMLLLLVLKNIG